MDDFPDLSDEDREMLAGLPIELLLDMMSFHIRNIWRVDGLYFLGIEEKLGSDAATEIDAGVWNTMAKIEAGGLRKIFSAGENPDLPAIMELLLKSSWALDQPFKVLKTGGDRAVLTIERCRTQETRLGKGLPEFPCKVVRLGYLENFVRTLNPGVKVKCIVCPPDEHPEDLWCRWEFSL